MKLATVTSGMGWASRFLRDSRRVGGVYAGSLVRPEIAAETRQVRMLLSLEIPVEAEAVAMAREAVISAVATTTAAEPRLDDLRLLTSEIVTNALRHAGLTAGDSIGVAVEVSPQRVRVEVADGGPGFDPVALDGPAAETVGGWGLVLVEQLADAWGVIRNEPNFVWFELSL